MPLPVARMRRWLALTAVLIMAVVTVMYLYARWRTRGALKEIPGKIGVNIQQTAEGFKISKSEQGRTIFTIEASKAVQFKKGGHTELHNVSIILYGRDSSRFDQIYGDDFEYDPQTGDAAAKGEVRIDLEANPLGLATPDQTPPKELKNPIHLRTSALIFNQKTGNASTDADTELRSAQATGSARGVRYDAKAHRLTLVSRVEIDVLGPNRAHITAAQAIITKEPRVIVLDRPRMTRAGQQVMADKATLYLDDKNSVERILAEGDVRGDSPGRSHVTGRADSAEFFLAEKGSALRNAVLSGNVLLASTGEQVANASAGRVLLDFAGKKDLQKVHAEQGVSLRQAKADATPASKGQDVEITASAMDAFLVAGHLDRAETVGSGLITISQASSDEKAEITAARFIARFDDKNHLTTLHGAPDARIATIKPGQPGRVSTSANLDVVFRPSGGVESITQQGNLVYVDGDRRASADRARYTPADQLLVLSGSPRFVDSGMTTTADTMTLDRGAGTVLGEGNVKTTYSDLRAQPNGAMLAASAPIHVTARRVAASRTSSQATFSGGARLWQNANVVTAPTIEFNRDTRSVVAEGNNGSRVSTVLVQTDKSGKATAVTITCEKLTYVDSDRKVHFGGGVVARSADATISSAQMDAYLLPAGAPASTSTGLAPASGAKLDRIVAQGQVVITQPTRRATADQLTYTVADDRFTMTGGPPSIFDAERGKITGDSLTFYKRDDRVLVEGRETSPTQTTIRVAR